MFYRHRVLLLDKDFIVTKLTHAFYFSTEKVEYCLGWCYDRTGKYILMGLSLMDTESKLAKIKIIDLLPQLKTI